MRQVLFVVVMVGAAFLGGAVVNGPGLRWVQARLLDYMGLQDGGEIASIDLAQAGSDPADPHRQATSPAAGAAELSTQSAGDRKPDDQARSDRLFSGSLRPIRNFTAARPRQFRHPMPLPTTIPEPTASSKSSSTRMSAPPRLEPPMEPGKAASVSGGAELQPHPPGQARHPLIPASALHCWRHVRHPRPNPVSSSRRRPPQFLWKSHHRDRRWGCHPHQRRRLPAQVPRNHPRIGRPCVARCNH